MAESQDQYTRFISQGNRGCKIRPYSQYYRRGDPLLHLRGDQGSDIPYSKNCNEHSRDLHGRKKKVKKEKTNL